jgi:hypothetical protein
VQKLSPLSAPGLEARLPKSWRDARLWMVNDDLCQLKLPGLRAIILAVQQYNDPETEAFCITSECRTVAESLCLGPRWVCTPSIPLRRDHRNKTESSERSSP